MSWWVSLTDPVSGEILELDHSHDMRGGTYAVCGTREASLNVTYNYGWAFRHVLGEEGIKRLEGMTGSESSELLRERASRLDDDVDENYWKPTEGNAKRAILQLAALAELRPDGVWKVS